MAKQKKSDKAFEIYKSHLHLKDTMKKREFRALVVADISEQLGVTNKGTLGMYFAWAEQVVTGRAAAVYSRGDGSRARKGSKVDESVDADLNRMAFGFLSGKPSKEEAPVDEEEESEYVIESGPFGIRRVKRSS